MNKYPEEYINWLKENYGTKSAKEITKEFNQLFNTNKTEYAIKSYVARCKIPHTMYYSYNYKYSVEIRNWLKENISTATSYKELTKELNRIFKTDYDPLCIQDLCIKRLKIKLGKNIGTYGYKSKEEHPIGYLKVSNGTTYIKVKLNAEEKIIKTNHGYAEPYWKPLQKYIYEKEYGKIKENEMIIFLDGNNQNFNLENLACVTKDIALCLNRGHYYGYGHATQAMIEVLKTQKSLKETYDTRTIYMDTTA